MLKMVPIICSFARRTIASSTTLKSSVDNMSPCLSPCRVSKGSEESFSILTQHFKVVSVALVRRRDQWADAAIILAMLSFQFHFFLYHDSSSGFLIKTHTFHQQFSLIIY
jgi:hypothetical protein